MNEKLYEEIGNNYRFFLRWRHAAFAGQCIVLFTVCTLSVSFIEKAKEIAWVVPLAASPIGILFWIIDVRTRDLYHATIKAGAELEKGKKGFYTVLRDEVSLKKEENPFAKLTQSAALNLIFWGSTIMLLIASILLYKKYS